MKRKEPEYLVKTVHTTRALRRLVRQGWEVVDHESGWGWGRETWTLRKTAPRHALKRVEKV
nr:MAG TPA: hypothetical protein [Caudoviricetes sp.]